MAASNGNTFMTTIGTLPNDSSSSPTEPTTSGDEEEKSTRSPPVPFAGELGPRITATPSYCKGVNYRGEYTDTGLFLGLDIKSECLPKDFDHSRYYSPGTACPSDYTAIEACTRSDDASSNTTTLTCCPYRSSITMSCLDPSSVPTGKREDMYCTWTPGATTTVVFATSMSTKPDGSLWPWVGLQTISSSEGINGYGLRMVFTPEDLERGGGGGGGGLSTTNKIVLGVLVPIIVISLAVGIFFLVRRQRKRRGRRSAPTPRPKTEQSPAITNELPGDAKSHMVRNEVSGDQRLGPTELSGGETANIGFTKKGELPGSEHMPTELVAGHDRLELSENQGRDRGSVGELRGSDHFPSELHGDPRRLELAAEASVQTYGRSELYGSERFSH